METIGTGIMHDSIKEYEWRIQDFSSLSDEAYQRFSSPSFLFDGEPWHLDIYPNGELDNESVGCIAMYLYREFSGSPKKLKYSFSLKTLEGEKFKDRSITYVFDKKDGYGFYKYCQLSEILEKKSELVPSDVLTVFCCMKSCNNTTDNRDSNKTTKCSYCKEDFSDNYVSIHEQKCHAKPMECPKCKENVDKKKCFDHECQLLKLKGTKELADDLTNVFHSGEHSDVTITVKDKQFQLHRCILAGRNPFFSAMFKTEMKEKTTGIVTIDDCKPEVFRSFIHFLYTGKVDELSLENVCDLYEATDKYQEDRLKAECLCFMKGNMSVDTFGDFTILAHTYDEKELLQNATDFYCKNVKEIIRSVKWQTLMKNHPTLTNELIIKGFDYHVK